MISYNLFSVDKIIRLGVDYYCTLDRVKSSEQPIAYTLAFFKIR